MLVVLWTMLLLSCSDRRNMLFCYWREHFLWILISFHFYHHQTYSKFNDKLFENGSVLTTYHDMYLSWLFHSSSGICLCKSQGTSTGLDRLLLSARVTAPGLQCFDTTFPLTLWKDADSMRNCQKISLWFFMFGISEFFTNYYDWLENG